MASHVESSVEDWDWPSVQPPMADGVPGRQHLTDVQVMHSRGVVVVQIQAPVRTAIVLTADEADDFADSLRQQARHARDLALIPREDTDV
jgi:hypothetical protein